MRVSHVITRLIVGGAQENTIASVLGLRSKPGLDVELVAGPTEGAEGSLQAVVEREGCLTVVPELVRAVRPWTDWLACRRLVRHFAAKRPDIVHTHSGKAGILGRLAAREAGVPIVIHSIHGPSFGPFQGALANSVFTGAERHAGRITDHFVVVADAMTRQYLAAGIGRPEQYTRVFSGFDLDPFVHAVRDDELARRLGIAPDDFVIGKIARLFELKGHEDVFAIAPELVRRVPKAKFLFVGDGPWRQRFSDLARAAGLAHRFVLAGLVPPAEVHRYVGLMDCLVHLSRREGLPRALPQALASGRPVVAYDCDGAGEVCRTDETGFLISPGDHGMLVERLTELAARPELRRCLGEAGRRWVCERFTVDRLVQDQHELYLRLAKEKDLR
jgi:glycosyltransferase involved in cell wall biosynthesis